MPRRSNRSDRLTRILALIATHGEPAVEDIAAACGVSTMTVRRDLAELQQQGVLQRTHGGCVAQHPLDVQERSFTEKLARELPAKSAIADTVAGLIGTADSIYIDTGTTALLAARRLPTGRPLQITTNNLRVALELFGRANTRVTVLGGELAARSPELIGVMAADALQQTRFDLALLGADAVDCSTGEVTSADQPSAELSRLAWRRATRVLVLADGSKLGRAARHVSGVLGGHAALVTDPGADASHTDALRARGCTVSMHSPPHPTGKNS